MPPWLLGLLARGSRIRWVVVWRAARWLYRAGRDRLAENLSKAQRQELWELMRKSKGRRGNLSKKEQERFVALVRKAIFGSNGGKKGKR
jgi:hypothetical protein